MQQAPSQYFSNVYLTIKGHILTLIQLKETLCLPSRIVRKSHTFENILNWFFLNRILANHQVGLQTKPITKKRKTRQKGLQIQPLFTCSLGSSCSGKAAFITYLASKVGPTYVYELLFQSMTLFGFTFPSQMLFW